MLLKRGGEKKITERFFKHTSKLA